MARSPQSLEERIHQTLRALPEQTAPVTLEQRVLAALARRAALPWWRRSYVQWPLAVQAAFLLISVATLGALIDLGMLAGRSEAVAALADAVTRRFEWVGVVRWLGSALAQAGGSVANAIPPLWIYAVLAVLAICYAALLSVGAVAYRAFLPRR